MVVQLLPKRWWLPNFKGCGVTVCVSAISCRLRNSNWQQCPLDVVSAGPSLGMAQLGPVLWDSYSTGRGCALNGTLPRGIPRGGRLHLHDQPKYLALCFARKGFYVA